ncbi:hypothetical protein LZ30DRAFT_685934 [Colletotrichum cereale]|nr:hypothetical protein LZ30DRAFT_685934 [Colletotrichum cereale]
MVDKGLLKSQKDIHTNCGPNTKPVVDHGYVSVNLETITDKPYLYKEAQSLIQPSPAPEKRLYIECESTWGTTPLNQFRGNFTDDRPQILDPLLRNQAGAVEPVGRSKRATLLRDFVTETAQVQSMLLRYCVDPRHRDASGKDARNPAMVHTEKLIQDMKKLSDRRIDDRVDSMERFFLFDI